MMKKWMGGLLLGTVLMSATVVAAATEGSPIKFTFNGVEQALPAGYTTLTQDNHTYVPARFIAEQLGAKVDWDEASQTVKITNDAGTQGALVDQLRTDNQNLQAQLTQEKTTVQALQSQLDQLKSDAGGTDSTAAGMVVTKKSNEDSTKDLNGAISTVYALEGTNSSMIGQSYTVQGQIRNISKTAVKPSKLTLIAYDYNGNVIANGEKTLFDTLQPNEVKPFSITVSYPTNASYTYLLKLQ